jgi:hypothetical protein
MLAAAGGNPPGSGDEAVNDLLRRVMKVLEPLSRATRDKLAQLYTRALAERNREHAQEMYKNIEELLKRHKVYDALRVIAVPAAVLLLVRIHFFFWLSWVVMAIQAGATLALVGVALLVYYQLQNATLLGTIQASGGSGVGATKSARRVGLSLFTQLLGNSGGGA